ncbi:OB-fold domain-containing protein [Oceanobacillus senegalensis]|uniref:OB-fold domain-containing protein n=1 Tax=Oceanobacillus senegalensis TaxID=1936063 RepID=UPI000A30AE58|nr:OB-fold domain-containing protein [Oceanobacillus senegalensis]
MRGILSYGAYIPYNRLKRSKLKDFFGISALKGEKAVAGFDEDVVSMGVEAGFDSLNGLDEKKIDTVYFATTNGPYDEKSSISTITKALDLRENVRGIESAHSLRAGTSSLLQALDQEKQTLVVTADCQVGAPSGANEQLFGDGAVSFITGSGDDVIARLVDSITIQDEILGQWRSNGQEFEKSWEERFFSTVFTTSVKSAVSQVLEKSEISLSDISKIAISAPGKKGYSKIAKALGVGKEQVQDPLFDNIGQTGTAHAGMLLVDALENAKPGDYILVANFAEGTDIILLQTTDALTKKNANKGIKGHINVKNNDLSYANYLKWKGILETEPARRPGRDRPSAPAMHRNYDQNLGFYGSKCKSCGIPQFPKQRVCAKCQAKDQMEDYRFVGKTATITTYTLDYLAPTPAPPALIAVIDFASGGRIMCEVTDCEPEEIEIGMEVELTFRRLYKHGQSGIHNYFWKARPKRVKGVGVDE